MVGGASSGNLVYFTNDGEDPRLFVPNVGETAGKRW